MKKVALVIALASSLLVSGCATGFNAQTNKQGPSGNGRTADVDGIKIRNAVIIVDKDDQSRATLIATVLNTAKETDLLKTVEVDPAITVAMTEIELKKNDAISIGYNSEVAITFTTLGKSLAPGQFVDVKFIFANNNSIELSLLVMANTEYYSDVVVPEIQPTPEPSASS